MKNNISKIVAIFVALIFAVGGFFYYTSQEANDDVPNEDEIVSQEPVLSNYTIEAPTEDNTLIYSTEVSELSLFDVLKSMNESDDSFNFAYEESEYGAFVTSINGYTADSTKEFWSVSINGESAMVGVSDLYPVEGDEISFAVEAFE